MVYQWKQARYAINAQLAGEELERIENKYGKLVPQDVVDESAESQSVLHDCFEWENDIAANEFRKVQAKELVRNILTVKISESKVEIPTRAYVSVKDEVNNHSYVNVGTALATPDYSNYLLAQAFRDLLAFKQKYKNLMELTKVIKSIDEFVQISAAQ